jgi:hypothetical protein
VLPSEFGKEFSRRFLRTDIPSADPVCRDVIRQVTANPASLPKMTKAKLRLTVSQSFD